MNPHSSSSAGRDSIRNRRQFLAEVGRGMVIASVGATVASELGLAEALAEEPADLLEFGTLEPLVQFMQETAPERLVPELAGKLRSGIELRRLVTAAALANARTF